MKRERIISIPCIGKICDLGVFIDAPCKLWAWISKNVPTRTEILTRNANTCKNMMCARSASTKLWARSARPLHDVGAPKYNVPKLVKTLRKLNTRAMQKKLAIDSEKTPSHQTCVSTKSCLDFKLLHLPNLRFRSLHGRTTHIVRKLSQKSNCHAEMSCCWTRKMGKSNCHIYAFSLQLKNRQRWSLRLYNNEGRTR